MSKWASAMKKPLHVLSCRLDAADRAVFYLAKPLVEELGWGPGDRIALFQQDDRYLLGLSDELGRPLYLRGGSGRGASVTLPVDDPKSVAGYATQRLTYEMESFGRGLGVSWKKD